MRMFPMHAVAPTAAAAACMAAPATLQDAARPTREQVRLGRRLSIDSRSSGNSARDRRRGAEEDDEAGRAAVSEQVKRRHELFHDLGSGWDEQAQAFAGEGRPVVTGEPEDSGAFKTPGLREVHLGAPSMHDGSPATLEDAVEHCRKGGAPNPRLSPRLFKLQLTDADVAALVPFMEAPAGEGCMDETPAYFPQ
jgi:cytochrome c peroxidase